MEYESAGFWSTRANSGHPENDRRYFAAKAAEHSAAMAAVDRSAPAVDFACGAGELLEQMLEHVQIVEGIDYSDAMLAAARGREAVRRAGVDLRKGDAIEYSAACTHPVWLTSQGLNQYLGPTLLRTWLATFRANSQARSLYLFDTINPHLWRALRPAARYRPPPKSSALSRARTAAGRSRISLDLARHPDWASLGSSAMGYGYAPAFFRSMEPGLRVHFVSSCEFEYRYHVALVKR